MFVMSEFGDDEKVISQYSLQTNGQIAPMVEHCVEAATVQVPTINVGMLTLGVSMRILFCPQEMI